MLRRAPIYAAEVLCACSFRPDHRNIKLIREPSIRKAGLLTHALVKPVVTKLFKITSQFKRLGPIDPMIGIQPADGTPFTPH